METTIDSRPGEPTCIPLLGRDEHLLELLVGKAHHVYNGLKKQVFHRSATGTAASLRSGHMGVFIPGGRKIVSQIMKKCHG